MGLWLNMTKQESKLETHIIKIELFNFLFIQKDVHLNSLCQFFDKKYICKDDTYHEHLLMETKTLKCGHFVCFRCAIKRVLISNKSKKLCNVCADEYDLSTDTVIESFIKAPNQKLVSDSNTSELVIGTIQAFKFGLSLLETQKSMNLE